MNVIRLLDAFFPTEDKKLKSTSCERSDITVSICETEENTLYPFYAEVCHPDFEGGRPMVVDQYFSYKEALKDHQRLVSLFIKGVGMPTSVEVLMNREIRAKQDTKWVVGCVMHRTTVLH